MALDLLSKELEMKLLIHMKISLLESVSLIGSMPSPYLHVYMRANESMSVHIYVHYS